MRFSRQALTLFTGKSVSTIINLLIVLLIARSLGSNGYGVFSLASTIMIMVYTIFNFGIESSIVYYISSTNNKNKKRVFLDTVLIIRLLTTIIGSIILFYSSNFIESLYNVNNLSRVIKSFSLGYIGYSLFYLTPSIFQAFKNFKLSMITDITSSLIKLVIIYFSLSSDVIIVSLAFNISLIISAVIAIINVIKLRPKGFSGFNFRKIFSYSIIIYVGAISIFIINYINNLILGSTPINVSFITIGAKIGAFIVLPASSIGMVLFPHISGGKNINNYLIKSSKYSIIITFFLVFLVIISGSKPLTIILGEDYSNGWLIISLLMIGYLFSGISMPLINFYQGINKPIVYTRYLIIQGLTSLISSIILIKLFGVIGASVSFIISNTTLFLLMLTKSIRDNYKFDIKTLIKSLLIVSVSSLSVLINDLIIRIIVYISLFLLLIRVLRVTSIKEIKSVI